MPAEGKEELAMAAAATTTSFRFRVKSEPKAPAPFAERPWVHVAALLLWSALLFGYGIGAGELYRNETLRAYLAKECLARGDFVVPHLYGEPLLTKPPGHYVFIALSSLPFGAVTAVSARLPAAIMATASVLALYWLCGRYVERRKAWLSAMFTPCFLLWLDKATSAEMELPFVGWVVLSIAFFDAGLGDAVAAGCARRGARAAWLMLAALCLAAGTLTKWTAGIYVGSTFAALILWRRDGRALRSPGLWLALALAIGLVGMWACAVVRQVGWAELKAQLWTEAAPRLFAAEHLEDHPSKHLAAETLLHPLKVLGCTLPLGPLALLTLVPSFWRVQDENAKRLLQLLHCWAWPNLLLFTLLPEHASRHSLPFCPAFTALAGLFVASVLMGRIPDGWRRWSGWLTPRTVAAFLLLWLAVKAALVQALIPARDRERQPAEKAAALARLLPQGEPLYLSRVKDEGLTFYLGREVRRVRDWARLPAEASALLLTAEEWTAFERRPPRPVRAQQFLKDTQNDTIVYVRLATPAAEAPCSTTTPRSSPPSRSAPSPSAN